MAEKDESQQRIKDLEEDIKILNHRKKEENGDLERHAFETYATIDIHHWYIFTSLGLKQCFCFAQAEGESEENVQSNET